MRYFLDTEFAEAPGQLDLISLGLVAEDGRELYAVLSDGWSVDRCNPWVVEHVLPNLGAEEWLCSRAALREGILEMVGGDKPEFWGYYADYDWVAFCWLFGAMVDLPKGWPMYCRDLKQVADQYGVSLPFKNDRHNALDDARDLSMNYEHVRAVTRASPW